MNGRGVVHLKVRAFWQRDRMRDIFTEGLLYLDLLELYGSTYVVADICEISQSNVFRGANACAKLLRLDLTKDKKAGTYSIQRNHDVQRDLRKVNQRLRARENGQVRLLASTALPSSLSREALPLVMSLPALSINIAEQLELLRTGIVDLLICGRHELPADSNWEPSPARPDLFTPCDGLVASLIGRESYAVLASDGHPLRTCERPIGWCDLDSLVLLVVGQPSLAAWQQRFYQACFPSSSSLLHASDLHRANDCLDQPWYECLTNPGASFLVAVPNHHFQQACVDEASVVNTRLQTQLDPPQIDVVALSAPHLVREPMFRKLMEALRSAYTQVNSPSMEMQVP